MSLLTTNVRGGSPRLPLCNAQRPATTTRLPSFAVLIISPSQCPTRVSVAMISVKGSGNSVHSSSCAILPAASALVYPNMASAPRLQNWTLPFHIDHKDRVLREFEQRSLL